MAFIEANLQFVVLLAAAATGIGILWRRVIRPLAEAGRIVGQIPMRLDRIEESQNRLCGEQRALRKTVELFHALDSAGGAADRHGEALGEDDRTA